MLELLPRVMMMKKVSLVSVSSDMATKELRERQRGLSASLELLDGKHAARVQDRCCRAARPDAIILTSFISPTTSMSATVVLQPFTQL